MSFFHRCQERWADLNPLWRFLIACILIAALAFAAGRPLLEIYRDWRDDRRVVDAQRAAAEGRPAEARELALAVLRRDATRREALPPLLHAAVELKDPRQTDVAFGLLGDPDSAPADRAEAWRVCCRTAGAWRLQTAWQALPESERLGHDFVCPFVDRMLRDGMLTDANLILDTLPAPPAPEIEFRRMQLLIAKGTDEAFQEFQRILIGRLPELPADSPIVTLLDDIPQGILLPGLHGSLRFWMENNQPSPAPEAALRLARCHISDAPEQADKIIRETLAEHRSSAPLAAARWCLQIGRHSEADEILTSLPSTNENAAFLLHCQVIDKLGDLARWQQLMSTAPESLPAMWRHCELAHLANLAKNSKTRDASADAAYRAASESKTGDDLIVLARQADSRGLTDLSRRAWVEAIRRRTGPLPLSSDLQSLFESLAADKKEIELLDILVAYRILEPRNPFIVAQHDYLACLMGHLSPEILIENLKPIQEMMPDAVPVRCALALGYLLLNQAETAAELTDMNVDWFIGAPANRAIRALALSTTGREEEAAILFDTIPWSSLLQSESRIFSLLKKSK
jgi:hypothetical protein